MYTIENDYLKLTVNPSGGAIASLYDKKNNCNLMYTPDSRSWGGTDVVIFPFVARLKNGQYSVNCKNYVLKNHGIIRYENLNLKEINNYSLVLEFNSNAKTKEIYPFDFHFEIKYFLINNKLNISYLVKNLGKDDLYFSLGGHPALKTSGYENENEFEFTNTMLEFEKDLSVKQYILNSSGSLIIGSKMTFLPKKINLKKNFITDAKTLIYDASNINQVILKTNGYRYTFDLKESEVLAIWTWPGYGDYICVEPWWGIPDMENPNPELKNKPLIHTLGNDEVFNTGYSITIVKE